MSKSKEEEALQFLDHLDSLNPTLGQSSGHSPSAQPGSASGGDSAQDVLAFIDELTQKSSEPPRTTAPLDDRSISRSSTPNLRKSTERVKVGSSGSPHPSSSTSSLFTKNDSTATLDSSVKTEQAEPAQANAGRWGWAWTRASAAMQQARSVVDEQVKNLPKNEQVSKWSEGMLEYAKTAQLDKLGQDFKRVGLSTLTDILNVVAPPISEHEIIQVWLSHDMKGYDGVESIVFHALTKVMEQVGSGDLTVNRVDEVRNTTESEDTPALNTVDGYDAAIKLAQANLSDFVKNNAQRLSDNSTTQSAIAHTYIYLRIQPFMASPLSTQHASASGTLADTASATSDLQFVLHLSDPGHQLVHTTVTQAIPGNWLNLWDTHDWVEHLISESLRLGVETASQNYLAARMGWYKDAISADQQRPVDTNRAE
ncbi:hypothetical protein SERLA73DRAFT_186984 [Serpula lacrymans var. lacrymans S7.3]|uniref:Maintenance of telomere capping protein 1 n=2 Tax=Serpula lacrymans var. lacrymans TaxID=341189 RepID=F8Q879_SERL3|nr:uncharacterized protein SERLADRAFT_476299 [Serpula lacrymans var. lacrymans S7.9]EGN95767.1 hypothetical protein SERLA73DRAFT_186984 [Serpula lacrymans var. lacrymans S7.3]EGO21291.1 hypothetical protein SERLADRAFT_476299 [Serpula lacrymans var. lacrymans S7.9]